MPISRSSGALLVGSSCNGVFQRSLFGQRSRGGSCVVSCIQSRRAAVAAAARRSKKEERNAPTLLEIEALALEESPRQQRIQLVNAMLSMLEHHGIPAGYAFEFLRHGSDVIDGLCCAADREEEDEEEDAALSELHSLFVDSSAEGRLDVDRAAKNSSVSRVLARAERRDLPALVSYLHKLGMKASDVPKVIPFVASGTEALASKVEFLRSIGVRAKSLAGVLVAWPKILLLQRDDLAVAAEFLQSQLGFSSKSIGSLVTKTPRLLSKSADDLAQRVRYMESIGMSVKDIRRLVNRYPSALADDAQLKNLVAYLEEVGVRATSVGRVVAGRLSLLETDVRDLAPVISFLKSINASADDIDKIIYLYPGLFGYNPEADLRPMVTYLEKLGVPPILMGRLLRRHPRLLTNKSHMHEKVEFLLSLGLAQEDLGKVLFRAPQLMSLDVEDNMMPTVTFLSTIGVNLVKVLRTKPMILGYSVKSKIRPNLVFIQNLGLDSGSIGKLLSRCPHLLTLSVENNLQPTVCYFLKLGFQRKEIAEMVRRLPSLLGFSVSTLLAPKYEFFRKVMGGSQRELVQFPQYFSYSLTSRIIPRFERLGDHFQGHALGSVYSCSDEIFEKRLARWTRPVQVGQHSG